MKVVRLTEKYVENLKGVPQALDKNENRPYLVIDIYKEGISFFAPLHTVKSTDWGKAPKEWAIFVRSTEKGDEYVDLRKGFAAPTAEASGSIYPLDHQVYKWIAKNKPNFKAVARDRLENDGKLREPHSIDLKEFQRDIAEELKRQEKIGIK